MGGSLTVSGYDIKCARKVGALYRMKMLSPSGSGNLRYHIKIAIG